DDFLAGRIGETLAGEPGFVESFLPVPVQPEDLRAVDAALVAEWNEILLGGAPTCQRRGPLLRPAQIEDFVTGDDRRAVDGAGNRWRYLASRHSSHRLVDELQAFEDSIEAQ